MNKNKIITSISDLRYFIKADMLSCGYEKVPTKDYICNPIFKFQRLLRTTEFYKNYGSNYFIGMLFLYNWHLLQTMRD